MTYKPTNTDFTLSPYTGMTRQSWIDAAKYLLEGIFQYIKDYDQPVIVPRQESEITYPHKNASCGVLEIEHRAEMFEGLTRSFFIAAPLIHIEPEVQINGIKLRKYYKKQLLRSCTPDDAHCAGTFEQLQKKANFEDPFHPFQQTVETAAFVIGLWCNEEEIWNTYTKAEQDKIATFLTGFAHANTVPQNWRLFNMLDMAFLDRHGYSIDEDIMLDHAQAILEYYAGDGWYRDGQCFDYYSCWAFQVYGPIWNQWYGYEKMPKIAKKFEEYSNILMKTYDRMFDCDGHINMWGRSNIYRFATVSAFDGNLLLKDNTVNPGLARRICSGSLLQFLTREDFLCNGIPTMGFYGQFSPLVQGYSCAESPFWMGKAFLCLHLPEDHLFWTEPENNGVWDCISENEVEKTVLNGPGLCVTNHKANGETILRTGKVRKDINDFHGMWNYSKLAYNTKYPWEADNISQQYVLNDLTGNYKSLGNVTFWAGEKNDVLYRKQIFDYRQEIESFWMQSIQLADVPVPYGILRVDKLKLFRRPVGINLGSYGFPDNETIIEEREQKNAKAIILTGTDACGRSKQMAMTIYHGWENLEVKKNTGTNPDSLNSIILCASATLKKQYGGKEPYIFISQVITKEDTKPFSEEDIFPIQDIKYEDKAGMGTYGSVEVIFKNGTYKIIDFEGIEGNLSL